MSKKMFGSKLKFALDNLDSLPAMPEIAHKLLALPLETEAGEAQMISLIEQDPQLFAKIIGLANSPEMGVGRKINGIKDAAMLLGMKRLKSVAVGIATMSTMLNQPAGKHFDPHDLWTHSMTIAIVMHAISEAMPERIRPDENQVFLAGLLHDIGLAALNYLDFEASEELHHQLCLNPRLSIQDLELELFGVTHAHIGARLVRHWHLPQDIVDVVERHHSPPSGEAAYRNPLIRLVNIAEKLLPDFGFAEHTFKPITQSEWRELHIEPARAAELAELANELAMQVVQLPETLNSAQPAEDEDAGPMVYAPLPLSATAQPVAGSRFSMVVAPAMRLVKRIGNMLR
jgi:putative nucleotidyltransferase with HDIG domain